ncbi:helix-turn-helix domain-containing protein [Amycolatopsis panacis]|uniref:helix-turn-helix domain-containing protein n=1 Tax=Amycolatopsis panacis TaxID=2340917 RepID=UPI002D78FC69|nr:helix-turn-helix domain-containing protein [Amycolatopsis panacis]
MCRALPRLRPGRRDPRRAPWPALSARDAHRQPRRTDRLRRAARRRPPAGARRRPAHQPGADHAEPGAAGPAPGTRPPGRPHPAGRFRRRTERLHHRPGRVRRRSGPVAGTPVRSAGLAVPLRPPRRGTGRSRRRTGAARAAPKQAARVLRFERAGHLLRTGRHDLSAVALAAGYYDQAHLSNEWRALAGCSPRTWMTEELPNLAEEPAE